MKIQIQPELLYGDIVYIKSSDPLLKKTCLWLTWATDDVCVSPEGLMPVNKQLRTKLALFHKVHSSPIPSVGCTVQHASTSRISPKLCTFLLRFWPFSVQIALHINSASHRLQSMFVLVQEHPTILHLLSGLQSLLTSHSLCFLVYLVSHKVYAPSWLSEI